MSLYWESSHSVREAQRQARQMAIEHVLWLVYELPPNPLDRRSSPTLVFESEGVVRRVRDYPPDWRQLSEEELFSLSWRR